MNRYIFWENCKEIFWHILYPHSNICNANFEKYVGNKDYICKLLSFITDDFCEYFTYFWVLYFHWYTFNCTYNISAGWSDSSPPTWHTPSSVFIHFIFDSIYRIKRQIHSSIIFFYTRECHKELFLFYLILIYNIYMMPVTHRNSRE